MKQIQSTLATVVLAAVLSACSTLKAEPDKVKQVKKVAVIGYSIQQPVPPTFLQQMMSSGRKDNIPHLMGYAQESPHAVKIYNNLTDTLKNRLHWDAVSLAAVTDDQDYSEIFRENTEGFHNRPPAPKNEVTYGVHGLMDGWQGWRIDGEEKRKLMAKLGVDALVVASVRVELEKGGGLKALVGAADLHPRSTLEFFVYDKNSDDPIWHDTWARGETTEEGAAHVLGLTNYDALNEHVVESANSAFAELMKRIQTAGVTLDEFQISLIR